MLWLLCYMHLWRPLHLQLSSKGSVWVFDQQQKSVFLILHRWRVVLAATATAVAAHSPPWKIQPHFFSAVFISLLLFFSTCVFFSGYATLTEYFPHSSFYWTLSVLLIFSLGWAAQLEITIDLPLFNCSLNSVHIQSRRWSINFMCD